jgi:hypothetical protein
VSPRGYPHTKLEGKRDASQLLLVSVPTRPDEEPRRKLGFVIPSLGPLPHW